MRFILLFLISILSMASDFPGIFSSAGDEVFRNMQRYEKIQILDVYKDSPELLEAYCMDAKATMQKGFILDKMKEDPEVIIDKKMIKAYAKELRVLSNQNEQIVSQLDTDVGIMYDSGDFYSLKLISDAGFGLSEKMLKGIKEYEEKESRRKDFALANKKINKQQVELSKKEATPIPKVEKAPVEVPKVQKSELREEIPKPAPVPKVHKKTKLEYYEESLQRLKDELYALRESEDREKMACLNDITAINYWMIKVLQNSNEACERADAIRQMKSYNKASALSCGRSSIRYVEWRGRIKPYVGQKLFEAEAGCNK
ncbi:MAG: hypothetical protein COA44_06715 [Arcobacter sp.]|nr:MAG: hypothetical protein COA44_06715 [Arcobacter sp.]